MDPQNVINSAVSLITTAGQQATGPTWARLRQQTHAAYDPELWKDLSLLHEGGFEIQKNAARFIPRAPQEPKANYNWRLKATSYINYMARVVGYLVGDLFGVPLRVSAEGKDGQPASATPDDAFYSLFASDCDLQGTDFSQFMRERLVDAMVQKRALIGVDMPIGAPAVNKLQEEQMGMGRAWLCAIPLESMLNWKLDDKGRYQWCKLVKKVVNDDDPLGDHSSFYFEFKIWRMQDGVAAFEVYRTRTVTDEKEFKDEEIVPQVQQLTPTTFSSIPIINIDLPAAVWAGNQLGPLCKEHYNGRSDLKGSLCSNLFEIPWIKRGPEIPAVHGALPSETQQDPNRAADLVARAQAKGMVALGAGDDIGFAGPSGKAFTMAKEENATVRDEIFGALNTMALALANTGATVRRSGESKAEDRSATGVILDFLGGELREYAKLTYDCVSDGRGDSVKWCASGIDSYDDEDRAALIGEATEVETLTIPSKTFKKLYATNLAQRLLPKVSPAQKDAMAKEIEANITDEMVLPPKPLLGLGAGGGAAPGAPKLPPGAGKTNLPPKPPTPGK